MNITVKICLRGMCRFILANDLTMHEQKLHFAEHLIQLQTLIDDNTLNDRDIIVQRCFLCFGKCLQNLRWGIIK